MQPLYAKKRAADAGCQTIAAVAGCCCTTTLYLMVASLLFSCVCDDGQIVNASLLANASCRCVYTQRMPAVDVSTRSECRL
jgi:hypothetical protein